MCIIYLFYHENSPRTYNIYIRMYMKVHLNFIIMNITLEKCNVFVIAQNITTIVL